jgi:hypothetical protein
MSPQSFSVQRFAQALSEIPQFEIGGEVFLLAGNGAVNVRHVRLIEEREGKIILHFDNAPARATINFLEEPDPEPVPAPVPEPAPELTLVITPP